MKTKRTPPLALVPVEKPSLSQSFIDLDAVPDSHPFTAAEVGAILRLKPRAVRESLILTGKLPASQVTPRRWLVLARDLKAHIAATRSTAGVEQALAVIRAPKGK